VKFCNQTNEDNFIRFGNGGQTKILVDKFKFDFMGKRHRMAWKE